MIGYIEGEVIASEGQKVIILTVQGLGYEVYVPQVSLPGKRVSLFTSHIIREDAQALYGFVAMEEKRLFEMLVEVNGVGPKTAFGLIAHLGHSGVIQAIMLENANMLKEAPGIGKKGAEQIILSLKDKIAKLGTMPLVSPKKAEGKIANKNSQLLGETLQACQELGYKEQQVLPILGKLIAEKEFDNSEDLLKGLLREMR